MNQTQKPKLKTLRREQTLSYKASFKKQHHMSTRQSTRSYVEEEKHEQGPQSRRKPAKKQVKNNSDQSQRKKQDERLKKAIKITKINNRKYVRMPNFPKKAVSIMKAWLLDHMDNPYLNMQNLAELSSKCQLTKRQVQNWFTNARKVNQQLFKLIQRIWLPLQDYRRENSQKEQLHATFEQIAVEQQISIKPLDKSNSTFEEQTVFQSPELDIHPFPQVLVKEYTKSSMLTLQPSAFSEAEKVSKQKQPSYYKYIPKNARDVQSLRKLSKQEKLQIYIKLEEQLEAEKQKYQMLINLPVSVTSSPTSQEPQFMIQQQL